MKKIIKRFLFYIFLFFFFGIPFAIFVFFNLWMFKVI